MVENTLNKIINKKEQKLQISEWSISKHLFIVALGAILTFLMGFYFATYTGSKMPIVDSFTTVFSLFATYMVVKKILGNWLYWIVIDAASMYLYFEKGYYPTLVLFVFYTIMAAWGFKTWYEEYEQHQAKPLAQL